MHISTICSQCQRILRLKQIYYYTLMIRKNKPLAAYIHYAANDSPFKQPLKCEPARFVHNDQATFEASIVNGPAKNGLRTEYTQAAKHHLRTECAQNSQRFRLAAKHNQILHFQPQKSAWVDYYQRAISAHKYPRQIAKAKSPSPQKQRPIEPKNNFRQSDQIKFGRREYERIFQDRSNYGRAQYDRLKQDKSKYDPSTGKQDRSKSDRSRGKSALQNADQNKPKKSAYRLKYEYSNAYLLDHNRSSYTQFLRQKQRTEPPLRQKPEHSESESWKQLSFGNAVSDDKFYRLGQYQNIH